MSHAEKANNRAAEWIIAQEDRDLTDAERAAMDAWLAESDGNRAAYWRLKRSWREADRIGALGRSVCERKDDVVQGGGGRARWLPWSVAASILAAIAGLGYFASSPIPSPTEIAGAEYATQIGGRQSISLDDGSRVELNTASQIRAVIGRESREVWLERGEAYFEVKHLTDSAFVVHAGNRKITVLGTKFSVLRDGERVTVSVVEGRVRLAEMNGADEVRSAIIIGGDVAVTEGKTTLVAEQSQEKVENALAWREGMLRFDETRLDEAAAELNRYNTKPIIVSDEVAHVRIGGSFPAADSDAFVRLLRDAYGLTVSETAQAVEISK